jgi:hypothetical protein
MLHQEPHNAAQADVGRLMLRRSRITGDREPHRARSSFSSNADAEIMRESRGNNND